jgi:transcriptional regulator with XRE-family HTH domain
MSQHGDPVGFGAFLRDAIRAAGFNSPSQFARHVNLDPSVVLRWLNGTQRPTIASLERVAPALHLTIADLVRAAYPDRVPGGSSADDEAAVLTHEISRLLAPDSPISAQHRDALIVDLDRTLERYRHVLETGPGDLAETA